jgi:hypothetical protein
LAAGNAPKNRIEHDLTQEAAHDQLEDIGNTGHRKQDSLHLDLESTHAPIASPRMTGPVDEEGSERAHEDVLT